MKNNCHFSEVVASCLTSFTAQCWQWDSFPHFGSLVAVEEKEHTIIGLVHALQTGSLDPVRYPFTYQKTYEQLQAEQPQIFEFLKTTFSSIPIAYSVNGKIYHILPSQPVKIHAFVGFASKDIVQKMLYNHHYLHLLFGLQSQLFNLDELLLAFIQHQQQIKLFATQEYLREFLQTYALLVGNDYRRIKLFAGRLQALVL